MGLWFSSQLGIRPKKLKVVSADASFRRYFRVQDEYVSYVLVDAPPATEKNIEFVAYAEQYAAAGLDVPCVLFSDFSQGFMCLTDLGNQTLLPLIEKDLAQQWYSKAVRLLPLVAKVEPIANQGCYNRDFFQLELNLFNDWFCRDLMQAQFSPLQKKTIDECFSLLIDNALAQPQVSVHRDFHARNIMVRDNNSLSIIDFQDTVTGPLTYDAVSLLKDCYFKLDEKQRDDLIIQSFEQFQHSHNITCDYQQYKQWLDLMGLQRHLKVCGIFSRLHLRDNKSHYLGDLPLVVEYISDVCGQYKVLVPFKLLFDECIVPVLTTRINECLR